MARRIDRRQNPWELLLDRRLQEARWGCHADMAKETGEKQSDEDNGEAREKGRVRAKRG